MKMCVKKTRKHDALQTALGLRLGNISLASLAWGVQVLRQVFLLLMLLNDQ